MRFCKACGQPMRPGGFPKRPNEYDHASGCPEADTEVPIISLSNPWAMWVFLGWKTIETRTHNRFAKLAGKRIWIHASKTYDREAISLARPYLTPDQLHHTVRTSPIAGAIICGAFVREQRRVLPSDAPAALIECDTLRHGIFLEHIDKFDPVPFKGHLGIFYYRVKA